MIKSYDSEEENETLLEIRVSIEMKNYAHEYCALYTYVCNINKVQIVMFFFKT